MGDDARPRPRPGSRPRPSPSPRRGARRARHRAPPGRPARRAGARAPPGPARARRARAARPRRAAAGRASGTSDDASAGTPSSRLTGSAASDALGRPGSATSSRQPASPRPAASTSVGTEQDERRHGHEQHPPAAPRSAQRDDAEREQAGDEQPGCTGDGERERDRRGGGRGDGPGGVGRADPLRQVRLGRGRCRGIAGDPRRRHGRGAADGRLDVPWSMSSSARCAVATPDSTWSTRCAPTARASPRATQGRATWATTAPSRPSPRPRSSAGAPAQTTAAHARTATDRVAAPAAAQAPRPASTTDPSSRSATTVDDEPPVSAVGTLSAVSRASAGPGPPSPPATQPDVAADQRSPSVAALGSRAAPTRLAPPNAGATSGPSPTPATATRRVATAASATRRRVASAASSRSSSSLGACTTRRASARARRRSRACDHTSRHPACSGRSARRGRRRLRVAPQPGAHDGVQAGERDERRADLVDGQARLLGGELPERPEHGAEQCGDRDQRYQRQRRRDEPAVHQRATAGSERAARVGAVVLAVPVPVDGPAPGLDRVRPQPEVARLRVPDHGRRHDDHPVAGQSRPPGQVEPVTERTEERVGPAEVDPDVPADERTGDPDAEDVVAAVVLALVELARLDVGHPPAGAGRAQADLEQALRVGPRALLDAGDGDRRGVARRHGPARRGRSGRARCRRAGARARWWGRWWRGRRPPRGRDGPRARTSARRACARRAARASGSRRRR